MRCMPQPPAAIEPGKGECPVNPFLASATRNRSRAQAIRRRRQEIVIAASSLLPTIMSNLPEQTSPVYATDEDIAVRAGGDFITLCPGWQQMAYGTDGYFSPGSPWVLNSTATNFAANNVAPNQVVWLSQPKSQYPGGGVLLAIDSVARTSITFAGCTKT